MGRPSNRRQRRSQILRAFTHVLADHGFAGSTIARVAAESNLSPGLLHYHFKNKEELLSALSTNLIDEFRRQASSRSADADPLFSYVHIALSLNGRSNVAIARCWVGLFAEAIRTPALFLRFRRLISREIDTIQKMSKGELSYHDAAAVLAFIIGSLVMGAFAPKKTAGFAAPMLQQFIEYLRGRENPIGATSTAND